MTNKSDTPETNEAIAAEELRHVAEGHDDFMHYMDMTGMLAALARKLERELAALKAENERLNVELQKRDKCAFIGPMRDCPTHGDKTRSTK